jgi:hypothetical protein
MILAAGCTNYGREKIEFRRPRFFYLPASICGFKSLNGLLCLKGEFLQESGDGSAFRFASR